MPIDPSVITVSGVLERPTADWQSASKHILALPGVIVIEMAQPVEKWKQFYLPDGYAKAARPDMGVVIAKGEGSRGHVCPHCKHEKHIKIDLNLGDVVLVRPDDGLWREGFSVGTYKAKSQVRCYGVFVNALAPGHPEAAPWYDSIMAVWNEDGTLSPTWNNVVARLDPPEETTHSADGTGLILSDLSKEYSWAGEVELHGSECSCVVKGDRVLINPDAAVALNLSSWGDNLAIVSETGIEMILM